MKSLPADKFPLQPTPGDYPFPFPSSLGVHFTSLRERHMCLEYLHFFQSRYNFTFHGFLLFTGPQLLRRWGPQNCRGENNWWATDPYQMKMIHLFSLSALSHASELRQIMFAVCMEGLAHTKFQTMFWYFVSFGLRGLQIYVLSQSYESWSRVPYKFSDPLKNKGFVEESTA